MFSTGCLQHEDDPGGILIHRSKGGLAGPWETVGAIPVPGWARSQYRPRHLWAPNVVRDGDTYHLYYAVSEFGRNHSAIGLATSTTPGDTSSWQDHGPILTSTDTPDFDYNAIDPMVLQDGEKWWITWGSFWSGLKLQQLRELRYPTGPVVSLASRPGVPHNPVEAPAITRRGQYYYLFMSWDLCCRAEQSTYKIAVGRSTHITGPYVDRDGTRLDQGGGTVLLTGRGHLHAAGGQDVYHENGEYYLIYHSYDALQNFKPVMCIEQLTWRDEWPELT